MHCLNDYIGIKGYGSEEPLSGMFINQLPGITLESIDKLAEKEQFNFAGVWKDVQARAWVRLEKDFRIALRNRYKLSSIRAFSDLQPVADTNDIIAVAAKYRGIVIDLGGMHSRSFLTTHIDHISVILTANAANLVVKIFDADGTVLDTFTKANAPQGTYRFEVSKKYPTQKLFVAVDAEAVPLYKAALPKGAIEKCFAEILEFFETCKPQVYAAEADKATPSTRTKKDFFYGIEVSYSAMCSFSSIICANKEEFMDVWMYLLGAEIMLERLFTSRMNRYTTIDKDQAAELKDFFSVEYEKALKETVSGLEVKDDCCIECNPLISTRQSIP